MFKLKRHDNWRDLLLHAWSSRFVWALAAINGVDAGYSYLVGYAPVPQWAMGLLTCGISMLTLWARILVQEKLSGAAKNADT